MRWAVAITIIWLYVGGFMALDVQSKCSPGEPWPNVPAIVEIHLYALAPIAWVWVSIDGCGETEQE